MNEARYRLADSIGVIRVPGVEGSVCYELGHWSDRGYVVKSARRLGHDEIAVTPEIERLVQADAVKRGIKVRASE